MDVQEVIDEVLAPLIKADGGNIELVEESDSRVVVKLTAACVGCPGFTHTRDRVIVPVLRRTKADATIVVMR